jgi:hypothetical protein
MAWLVTDEDHISALIGGDQRILELKAAGIAPSLYVRIGDLQQTRAKGVEILRVQLLFFFGEQHYLRGFSPLAHVVDFGAEPTVLAPAILDPETQEIIRAEIALPSFAQLLARPIEGPITNGQELLANTKAMLYEVFNESYPVLAAAEIV